MSSPLLDYLNRARQVAPGGMGQMAGGFADLMRGMRFRNRPDGLTKPNRRAQAQPAPQGTSPFMNYINRPQGQQPTQPAMVRQSGPGQDGYGISYAPSPVMSDSSPTGQAAGNNASASGINSGAQGVAQGLSAATGIAGAVMGAPGISGLGMAINAMGLNDLNVPDVQINDELSTNDPVADVGAITNAMSQHSVGLDAINTANNAVSDGSSGGSGSGPSGVGADGSGGNMGDPSGEGGGGTYRKGGYIKPDRDKKLEARKVTAHEGEFVIRPEAVDEIGLELLRAMNARKR